MSNQPTASEDTEPVDNTLIQLLASGLATPPEVAQALAAGSNPNLVEAESGDTPLHVAARCADVGVCAALVAGGAHPAVRCAAHLPPLTWGWGLGVSWKL